MQRKEAIDNLKEFLLRRSGRRLDAWKIELEGSGDGVGFQLGIDVELVDAERLQGPVVNLLDATPGPQCTLRSLLLQRRKRRRRQFLCFARLPRFTLLAVVLDPHPLLVFLLRRHYDRKTLPSLCTIIQALETYSQPYASE